MKLHLLKVLLIAMGALLILHIALPCKTNSVKISNETNRVWIVELGVCGGTVWIQDIEAHATRMADFEMVCGESSISVKASPNPSPSSNSLSGEYGYLQPHIWDEGTVFIEANALRHVAEPLPSLIELAYQQIFGTTRCWAG